MIRYDQLVDGNNFISHFLKKGYPFIAGKIGVTELNLLQLKLSPAYSHGFNRLKHEAENIAGLYPFNEESLRVFTDLFISSIKNTDLLCKWSTQLPAFEKHVFNEIAPQAYPTPLQHLEPYFFDNPWTNYLEGKRVLVISPFSLSIENNYHNIEKIWNGKIKKNFELITMRHPFALPLQPSPFWKSSQDVYEHHIKSIRLQKFDVALIGTGHTSMLYAYECKKLGKAAIHLGGATQILFGIKGQRWKDIPEFQKMFNEHWTEPYSVETPTNKQLCEGGCYWA